MLKRRLSETTETTDSTGESSTPMHSRRKTSSPLSPVNELIERKFPLGMGSFKFMSDDMVFLTTFSVVYQDDGWRKILDPQYSNSDTCEQTLATNQALSSLITRCTEIGDFTELFASSTF